MNILQKLAHFSANLEFSNINQTTIDKAKYCVLDTFGVGLMGVGDTATKKLTQTIFDVRGSHNGAKIYGYNKRLDPASAAFVNTFAADLYDFDDTTAAGFTHPSAVIVPVVMALGEYTKANGKDIVCAIVAGWEISGRLGLSMPQLVSVGWHCTSIYTSLGAAAASARILKLSETQILHAMGLMLCQVGGLRACNGTKGKPYTFAKISENAVTAALLAKSGLECSELMLEGKEGFFNVFAQNKYDKNVFEKLGEPFILEEPGVCVKSYPLCSSAQAPIEAVEKIMEEHNLNVDNIMKIHCESPQSALLYLVYDNPQKVEEAQFSLTFVLAATACNKKFDPKIHLSDKAIFDPKIKDIIQKVTYSTCLFLGPEKLPVELFPEGAYVTITTNDGKTYDHCIGHPAGSASNPLSKEKYLEKFATCAGYLLGKNEINVLAHEILKLDSLLDINELSY